MNSLEFVSKDKDGKEVKLIVKRPTITDETQARFVANAAFGEAIKGGALFKDELDKVLRDRGIWDDKKQKDLETYQATIKSSLTTLKQGGIKKSEARKLAIEARIARGNIIILLSERNKHDDFTVESQVENKKFEYLVSCCTFDENGKKVFANVEDYRNRAEEAIALDSATNFARLNNGLDSDWQKKLPENKFLLEHGFADEKLDLVNKDGHRVSIDGKLIDDNYNYVQIVDGKEEIVDADGNLLDEDGLPKVETQPFLDD